MLLTGHKTRAIFDRYNIIHEQELLDAGDQLVAYLAQQAQAPRGRAHPASRHTAREPPPRPNPPPRRTKPPTPPRVAPVTIRATTPLSGATPRCLKPGCSERIGNSRRTGCSASSRRAQT